MDSKNGGLSASEKQRQAAAELARQKALASYEKVTQEDWKKYHTAWQSYYQKYYSDYYMKAAKDFVAKQAELSRNDSALKIQEQQGSAVPVGAIVSPAEKAEKDRNFRAKLQERMRENEAKSTRRLKWTPILAGLAVVLTILFLQYNHANNLYKQSFLTTASL